MGPEDNQNTAPTQKTVKKSSSGTPIVIGIVVLLLVAAGVYAFISKDKKTETTTTNQSTTPEVAVNKTAELSTDPATATTQNGQVATFSIWLDTGGQTVGALQANLTYPTDQYDFVSIDDSGSAFEIKAESTGGDGKVTIARGQIGGVTGKQLVAKVNLKAKTTGGQGNLAFTEDSRALTLTEEPQNILNKTSGASLTLGE